MPSPNKNTLASCPDHSNHEHDDGAVVLHEVAGGPGRYSVKQNCREGDDDISGAVDQHPSAEQAPVPPRPALVFGVGHDGPWPQAMPSGTSNATKLIPAMRSVRSQARWYPGSHAVIGKCLDKAVIFSFAAPANLSH